MPWPMMKTPWPQWKITQICQKTKMKEKEKRRNAKPTSYGVAIETPNHNSCTMNLKFHFNWLQEMKQNKSKNHGSKILVIEDTSTCPAWKRSNAPSMYTTRAFGAGPWSL